MPKFYVESGNLQMVVHANNARGAAIWAVHRAMSQMLPFLTDMPLSAAEQEPLLLAELIKTNECGFGRPDSLVHETFAVVSEWNQLMVALDKLHEEAAPVATAV